MAFETSHSLLDRLQDPANVRDWEFFVELYRPWIQRSLMRYSISPEDADDLCQETLLAMHRSIAGFQHNGHPGAFRRWLLRITHLRALNFLRQRRKGPIRSSDLPECDRVDRSEPDPELEATWDREHDRYVVDRILHLIEHEFTKSTWIAFEMQVLLGQNADQAAASTGISVNAALIAKSRVMRRLREVSRGLIDEWRH